MNRMKKIAAFVLAMMMAVLCLTACGGGSKVTLTVVDGNTKTEVEAAAGDKIADILKSAGIILGAQDTVEPAAETALGDGVTKITVKRYIAPTEPAATAAQTEPAATEAVASIEYKEVKETETIAYSTEEQYSSDMVEGTSEVTRQGSNGEKEITYKVKYVDGKEESREKIAEKITKEPVSEIITYGTGTDTSGNDGASGKTEVSRVPYYDCDGSGHGYWEVTYSDGSVEYIVF